MTQLQRWLGGLLVALASLTGLVALVLPFIVPLVQSSAEVGPALNSEQTPLLMVVLVTICLGVLLVEIQGSQTSAKIVAALGVMIAGIAALRFIEIGIPGPGGFSPIFAPIIIAGYVFGSRFGFLLGAMSILVSALITGGVGPWLPYQTLAAGWIGLIAGWLPKPENLLLRLAVVTLYGLVWGFLFGAIMNLYTWPYLVGNPSQNWEPGEGLASTLRSYTVYYLATSVVWDSVRAAGNVVLLLALGIPLMKALARFRDRLQFEVASA